MLNRLFSGVVKLPTGERGPSSEIVYGISGA
jgi:hypothetical protein